MVLWILEKIILKTLILLKSLPDSELTSWQRWQQEEGRKEIRKIVCVWHVGEGSGDISIVIGDI